MPELPEVETVRRGLCPVLEGRTLVQVVTRRLDLRWPIPANFGERLTGRRIIGLGRRSKYLLLSLDDGMVVLWHLGMSGRMTIHDEPPPPPGPHDHVDLVTDTGRTVRFTDPRRFGSIDLTDALLLENHPRLAGLGPEPLGNQFDGAALAAALAGRQSPLKTALLDQRVVAGLGNIYVCESLFLAGLSPFRRAGTVVGRRAERLAAAIRQVLNDAIAAGGSSLRDHRQANGELGYFQHHFAVYGRAGEACPGCNCAAATGDRQAGITRRVQGGRSTFFCSRRQR